MIEEKHILPEISGYRIADSVASGGTGTVFRAFSLRDNSPFALKVLHAADDALIRRMRSEFRLLTRLDHPSLLRVHDFGYFDDGRAWFIMDWIDGDPLAPSHVRDAEGVFDATRFATLVADIAAALEYIHSQHILHGDLKPGNILIDFNNGSLVVRLMDFGLSIPSSSRGSSGLCGTIDYMPPEAIRGERVGEAADLYALGCVLFEVASGHPPFVGENATAVLKQHLRADIPELPPEIPAQCAEWIRTLMQKQPPLRYRTAFQLHAAAASFLGREITLPKRDGDRSIRLPDIPREQEHALALEAREHARDHPVLLCISGSQGAGKTRLLRDIVTDMQFEGLRVLRTPQRPASEVFSPLLHVLVGERNTIVGDEAENLLQTVAASFPDIFPDILTESVPALDPGSEKIRLFHATAVLITEHIRPAALLIDDLHDVDSFTKEFSTFFTHFLDARADLPFLFLIGMEERGDPTCALLPTTSIARHIRLGSAGKQDLAKSLQLLFGSVSPSFVEVVHKQSKGLPGRAEDILNFCAAERIIESTDHGWLIHERDNMGSVFPDSIARLYEAGIQRLSTLESRVLSIICACPAALPEEALLELLDGDEENTSPALARLLQLELLEQRIDGFVAAHEAICHIVPAADENTHKALYRWFGTHPPLTDAEAVLAHHALHGGDIDEALPLLIEGARKRESRFDYAGAAALLRLALPNLRADLTDMRFAVLGSLSHLYNILGKRQDEEECLEEMLLLAARDNTPEKLAIVYKRQAEYHLATAEYERARRAIEKALAYFKEDGDLAGQAFCLQELGRIEYRTKPGANVLSHYQSARQLYADAGAVIDEGHILVDIGLVYYSILEHPDKAFEFFEQARTVFEAIQYSRGLTRVFGNIGAQCYSLGRYEEALKHLTKACELATAVGDRKMLATSLGAMAQSEIALCLFSPALLHLQEELRIAHELGDSYLKGKALENLGELYLVLGDTDSSIETYSKAQSIAEAAGDNIGIATGFIDIAGCHIEKREFETANKLLARAESILADSQDVNVSAMLRYRRGMLYLHCGMDDDLEKALECFDALGDIADRHGFASHGILARSYAALTQLRMGRQTAALDLSNDAVRLLREHGPLYGGSHDILYNHHLVLRAHRLLTEAAEAIERAHEELTRNAESISDPRLYRSYLEQVQGNAAIVRDYSLTHRGDSPHALSAVREQNLRTLYEVARKINSVLDLNHLLDNIMDSALESMNGERGMIFLIENEQLSLKASRNVEKETIRDATEISLSILRDVLNEGKPIIVSDTSLDDAFSKRDSVVNFNIHSLICVPMRSKNNIIGTVYVDSRSDAASTMSFSEIDADFLEAFANLATIAIENARMHEALKQENIYLRREVEQRFGFENIIGNSAPMKKLFAETQAAIDSESSVLIYGESGTGKELIAKAIHYNGPRKVKHFVAVDCGALPDTLLESELFGYKRGAFTGAVMDKAGLFEEADKGTLFLDEISNTSLAFQAKLLRVLQEGEFRRVGETHTRTVDVRIICATNTDLESEINNNRFRRDLFYRLNVIPITIPPLRDRSSDIPLLAQHFVSKFKEKHATPVRGVSTELADYLQQLPWQGNVRELENLVNRMIAQTQEELLTTKVLPQEYLSISKADSAGRPGFEVSLRKPQRLNTLMEVEKEHIAYVLKYTEGNKAEAARVLGVKRTTLIEKMKKLGMM